MRIKRIVRSLIFVLFLVVLPMTVKASDSVVIRTGYDGDTRYREMATFSSGEISSMGAGTYQYTYITNVGTVMEQVAYGTPLANIIQAAGIDYGSVKTINVMGGDGYYRSLSRGEYLDSSRLYYPNLRANWDYEAGQAMEGADSGAYEVPTILAVSQYATKSPTEEIDSGMMSSGGCLRLCFGQTNLYSVTSDTSIQNVTTIDITLSGYPPTAPSEVQLSSPTGESKIGSSFQLQANVLGDDFYMDQTVVWSSSDESIATVDQNGYVTVVGEGDVVITVQATDGGQSASVTIHCMKEEKEPEKEPEKEKPKETTGTKKGTDSSKEKDSPKKTDAGAVGDKTDSDRKDLDQTQLPKGTKRVYVGRQVFATKMENETDGEPQEDMAEINADVSVLEGETRDKQAAKQAAIGGNLCILLGAIWRLLRYKREV